jgi:hypothetical protein
MSIWHSNYHYTINILKLDPKKTGNHSTTSSIELGQSNGWTIRYQCDLQTTETEWLCRPSCFFNQSSFWMVEILVNLDRFVYKKEKFIRSLIYITVQLSYLFENRTYTVNIQNQDCLDFEWSSFWHNLCPDFECLAAILFLPFKIRTRYFYH